MPARALAAQLASTIHPIALRSAMKIFAFALRPFDELAGSPASPLPPRQTRGASDRARRKPCAGRGERPDRADPRTHAPHIPTAMMRPMIHHARASSASADAMAPTPTGVAAPARKSAEKHPRKAIITSGMAATTCADMRA